MSPSVVCMCCLWALNTAMASHISMQTKKMAAFAGWRLQLSLNEEYPWRMCLSIALSGDFSSFAGDYKFLLAITAAIEVGHCVNVLLSL